MNYTDLLDVGATFTPLVTPSDAPVSFLVPCALIVVFTALSLACLAATGFGDAVLFHILWAYTYQLRPHWFQPLFDVFPNAADPTLLANAVITLRSTLTVVMMAYISWSSVPIPFLLCYMVPQTITAAAAFLIAFAIAGPGMKLALGILLATASFISLTRLAVELSPPRVREFIARCCSCCASATPPPMSPTLPAHAHSNYSSAQHSHPVRSARSGEAPRRVTSMPLSSLNTKGVEGESAGVQKGIPVGGVGVSAPVGGAGGSMNRLSRYGGGGSATVRPPMALPPAAGGRGGGLSRSTAAAARWVEAGHGSSRDFDDGTAHPRDGNVVGSPIPPVPSLSPDTTVPPTPTARHLGSLGASVGGSVSRLRVATGGGEASGPLTPSKLRSLDDLEALEEGNGAAFETQSSRLADADAESRGFEVQLAELPWWQEVCSRSITALVDPGGVPLKLHIGAIFASAIAGVANGFFSVPGPPLMVFWLWAGQSNSFVRGVQGVVGVVANTAKILPALYEGELVLNWYTGAVIGCGAIGGVFGLWVGNIIHHKLSPAAFKVCVLALLLLASQMFLGMPVPIALVITLVAAGGLAFLLSSQTPLPAEECGDEEGGEDGDTAGLLDGGRENGRVQ